MTSEDATTEIGPLPEGYQSKRCALCGHIRRCMFSADPFNSEIRQDHRRMWLCDECFMERRREI